MISGVADGGGSTARGWSHLEQCFPTFLMLGTSFTEDDFSLDVGRGEFGRIQAHDIYCALYLYYYYISSTLDHQALDPRSWEPLTYRNLHWHAQWLTLAVGENNWGCWLKCDFLQWGQLKESDFLAGSSDLQKQRSQWPSYLGYWPSIIEVYHLCEVYLSFSRIKIAFWYSLIMKLRRTCVEWSNSKNIKHSVKVHLFPCC